MKKYIDKIFQLRFVLNINKAKKIIDNKDNIAILHNQIKITLTRNIIQQFSSFQVEKDAIDQI